ncbi:unnamed protein product [Cylindrotheca closterium]|uniref:Phosphomannomutase n=1 Tax=Cylindrotheca closterium TaxID=2856 RepID=A0AAD2CIG5_9STRA|nr:unnamed protein product [Cylindrotheca closterium]
MMKLAIFYLLPCAAWTFVSKSPSLRNAPAFTLSRRNNDENHPAPSTSIFSVLDPSVGTDGDLIASEKANDDAFLTAFFVSECDNTNMPPTLKKILQTIDDLASGSDVRGRFIDHPRLGNLREVTKAIAKDNSNLPALTPFATHCLGYAFATMLKKQGFTGRRGDDAVVCIGRDPRSHGSRLADAFGRGVEDVNGVRVVYTGIATTPSLFSFCRSSRCDGGVMVTASHLPADRNGLKFFTADGGFEKEQIAEMIDIAKQYAQRWHDMGMIPPSSGSDGVFCSEWVDWMPYYEDELKASLMKEVFGRGSQEEHSEKPLEGLKIVLNSGNGSGGFFRKVLSDLGADMSASLHTEPLASFPAGIPNPENDEMMKETIEACRSSEADMGILLDTDADRCGMVLKSRNHGYEPLIKNRLIAMMGVIMARQSPGCAIVTDSVTSTGLSAFLNDLGLIHIRHVRGYANVIRKARSFAETIVNAETAIETSGHCALKENDYLDDGTYTAIKVIGLMARAKATNADSYVLDLISSLQELPLVSELRLTAVDGKLDTLARVFDVVEQNIELYCAKEDNNWLIDSDNQEGIRVSTGDDGGYFMIRKSLHDPVLSLQIESTSREDAVGVVVNPLLSIFEENRSDVDLSSLRAF